ncbi:MAG: hypothetical protein V4505_20020 [Pseudomonadota bacterium]
MPSERLPRGIVIKIVSQESFAGWSALAHIHDQSDLHAAPLKPLPPVEHASRADAERLAFLRLRDWINTAWPRRTVPDPS